MTDPFGQLMNGHRTMVAAMVHQYDRCSYLNEKLANTFFKEKVREGEGR
jgi:hypothetical protein